MNDLVGLPKTLKIDAHDCMLTIENHKIVRMRIGVDDICDGDEGPLFCFVTFGIISENNWIFDEMVRQGLKIDALITRCIDELKQEDWFLFEAIERHQLTWNDENGNPDGEALEMDNQGRSIKGLIYRDYVDAKIISDEKFRECWIQTDVGGFDFQTFLKDRHSNIRADCINILKKTESYETLQKNLTPIINTFSNEWKQYKEKHIRKEFAEQLKKLGEDND